MLSYKKGGVRPYSFEKLHTYSSKKFNKQYCSFATTSHNGENSK